MSEVTHQPASSQPQTVAAPLLLEVRQIEKRFPGVHALRGVNLSIRPGEVLAIIGENGAGKSTLMKILAGVQSPDSGEINVDGRKVNFSSVRDAMRCGVALIHQELNMAENLQVGENIFLGREPRRFGLIDQQKIYRDSQLALQRLGLSLSPRTRLSDLSIGQQQMVEIAKAMSVNARVLIMDEPTSSLSAGESQLLFKTIRELQSQGVAIIYISHRLGEVRELCDRATVLRDGANAGELDKSEMSHDRMVQLMVGRDVSQFYSRKRHPIGEVVLDVQKLRTATWPKHAVSFSVRQGEIVGVAGLVGAGRTELLRALFGVEKRLGGSVLLNNKPLDMSCPQRVIDAGVALVPEDRKQHGVLLDTNVRRNIGLAGLRKYARAKVFLNSSAERSDSQAMIAKLRVKTPSDQQIVRYLSGGNQQKVVIGKWLALKPKLLLLDEPTRGIDVGAKQEIYQLMEQLASEGLAILFVSSELEEIIGMSDRVLVMHEGRFAGELTREELCEESIMQLATGKVVGTNRLV